jgi:glycosyltransferase involved in cell wall biosynthesis
MELARRGDVHRVGVFRREGFFLDAVAQSCGPVYEVGIRGMARLSTLTAIRRWAAYLKAERFQVLHAWDADAAIFGQFIAALAGIPLITSRRDLGQIYPEYKVLLMRRADRSARFVVANAKAIVDHFATLGAPREKFRIIPNILDLADFDQLMARPFSHVDRLPGGERVVMVARLDPEKDVPTFIYAAELVLKSRPDASFIVAGDGVERDTLVAMAANHGLEERMVFLGDVTDVPSLLPLCRVGVLTPSRNEGLSNTILEYLAAGLPVVATDCGGNRELVRPPAGGFVVPAGDASALARAILEFIRKPSLAKSIGEANRAEVAANFQPGVIGNHFAELYRDVVRSD